MHLTLCELDMMFEGTFPPSKNKEPSGNDISQKKKFPFPPSKRKKPPGKDISQEKMPNKSTTCILQ